MKVDLSSLARQLISLVMVLSFLLTACASNTALLTATPTSTSLPPTHTPTNTNTPAPTPTPSIAPPDAQGSALDQALLDETWNSDHIQAQKTQWEAWIHYWLNATNPPIVTDIKELRYALLTDPSDPPQGGDDPRLNEKAVLILTWRDPSDATKTMRVFFPVNTVDGGFQSEPPPVESPYEITAGTEPLLLSDGANRPLIWRGNNFVRIDPISGLAREVLSKAGEWVPAYGVRVIKPETYTPEQRGLLSQTPEVLKEGMPLSKCFVEGAFTQMFYCGSGNEVKAVYDQETNQVYPAMMMNSGKMLVVNQRGMHEMKLNPLTPDAADVVHILPEYWRKKVCNIDMSTPSNLQEVDMSPDGKTCVARLNSYLGSDMSSDRGKNIEMRVDTPIVIILTTERGDIVPTNRRAEGMVDYKGVKFTSWNSNLIMMGWRDKNIPSSTPESQLASDILEPLKHFLTRINPNLENNAFFLIQKHFMNVINYNAGRNNSYTEPVPVIYGQQLKVIR